MRALHRLQWLQATVWRDGMCYTQRFERGRAVTGLEARASGEEDEEGSEGREEGEGATTTSGVNAQGIKSGTCIQFMPDPTSKGEHACSLMEVHGCADWCRAGSLQGRMYLVVLTCTLLCRRPDTRRCTYTYWGSRNGKARSQQLLTHRSWFIAGSGAGDRGSYEGKVRRSRECGGSGCRGGSGGRRERGRWTG